MTLVSTVVVRKIAVQPSRRLLFSNPNRTMKPEPIPARLMITWRRVKVDRDMPRSMVYVLSVEIVGCRKVGNEYLRLESAKAAMRMQIF